MPNVLTRAVLVLALFAFAGSLHAQWSDVDEAAKAVDEERWGDARRSANEAIAKSLASDSRTHDRVKHDLAWGSKYLAISEAHFTGPVDAEYDWYIAMALDPAIEDEKPWFTLTNLRLQGAEHVGAGITQPAAIETRPPDFPKRALVLGLQQTISVEVVVDTNGHVRQPRLISNTADPTLAYAFMDALRRWRFKPAMRNGKPVAVVMQQSIAFRNPYAAPVLQPRD